TPSSDPTGIAFDGHGSMSFTEVGPSKIGLIDTLGTILDFPTPTANSGPLSIIQGPDGNLWFTEENHGAIGRVVSTVFPPVFTEFLTPTANSSPFGIAPGPDGNVWFTEAGANKIGRITPSGTITEFSLAGGTPEGIAAGPDGNMWFVEHGSNK